MILHDIARATLVTCLPVYSPDFVPCDLRFTDLGKKHLPGKRLTTDVDVKETVSSRLQTLDIDVFYVGI
jgi:hypothetical protein